MASAEKQRGATRGRQRTRLKAKPFPYHLGLFKRVLDSGLKGAQLAGGAWDPGRTRGGGLGHGTPGDLPLPAGSRAEVSGDRTRVPTCVPTCPGAHLAASSEAAAG